MSYKKSGVDQDKAEKLVQWIKTSSSNFSRLNFPQTKTKRRNSRNHLISGIGEFSALYRARFPRIKSPCLASTTDGVGTKIKIASYFESYESIGQDLVAMCINDLICSGAYPLFFLDYYACGHLNLRRAKSFLKGVQKACLESECSLVGGETAEMPDVYKKNDFDCAGFALGVVDEKKILSSRKVKSKDALIALASSGFHSNGFSLLRKIFKGKKDLKTWKKELLKPTLIYASLIKKLLPFKSLHAATHITGGGMDNLLRVLPEKFEAHLLPWTIPQPFLEVKKRTKLSWKNFLKTFNSGIGMILVVDGKEKNKILNQIKKTPYHAFDLGFVIKSKDEVKRWIIPKHFPKT